MMTMPSMSLRNRHTLGKSSALTEQPIHWKSRYSASATGMPTVSVLNTHTLTTSGSFCTSSWNYYAMGSQGKVNVSRRREYFPE